MFNSKESKFMKFDKKIWLASPTMHGPEKEYMNEAYDSNWMSTIGENINQVEKLLAEKIGCKYAVALSAGTASLHLAAKAAKVKRGEKIFCSDLTFAATINPFVYEGANPIFIDSEYKTWNMDPKALEKAFELYPDVKKVVLVHLYGVPSQIDEIKSICDKYGASLIEDAAEALGASYNGKNIGSFGQYNAISFNGNKIITGSSGGMFLTNKEEDAKLVRKYSTQSREDTTWYQHKYIGYNYRMSNVIAGVIRGQIAYLDEHIEKKKNIYYRYKEGLKDLPVSMNPFEKEASPNYWLSCMLIDKDYMCHQERTDLIATFKAEAKKSCPTEILQTLTDYNVEGRPIWKPMHLQPIYEKNDFVTAEGLLDRSIKENASVGADLFNRGICLPSDIKMTEEEQDQIIEIIRACFE